MTKGVVAVRVTLKGRPLGEFVFSESRITIGRDPQSDIFLDNPGISRCHALLVREDEELFLHDQDSANGTFLNDEQVRRVPVRDGDRVRIGKFLLEIELEEDRRAEKQDRPQTAFPEGTMVLEPAQIERLMFQTKKAEQEAAERSPVSDSVPVGNVLRVRDIAAQASREPAVQPSHDSPPRPSREPAAAPSYDVTVRNAPRPATQPVPLSVSPPAGPSGAPPVRLHPASTSGSARSSADPNAGHPGAQGSRFLSLVRGRSRADAEPLTGGTQGSGFLSLVRSHAIGIGVGFSLGVVAGILIAKTLLG